MNIKDIIGKGKDFEPPFTTDRMGFAIYDGYGSVVFTTGTYGTHSESELVCLLEQICALLNREHKSSNKRLCLRDKSKVCDLCHDCDVDL